MAVVSASKSSAAPMSRSLRPRPSTQTQMGADAGKLPMVNVVETGLLRETPEKTVCGAVSWIGGRMLRVTETAAAPCGADSKPRLIVRAIAGMPGTVSVAVDFPPAGRRRHQAWRRQPGRLDERDRDRRLADGQIEGIGGVAHVGPEHNRLPGRRVEARRHHRIAQVTGEVGSVT